MPKRSYDGLSTSRSARRRLYKRPTSSTQRIKKTILRMSENKRNYLHSGLLPYAHVAGSGAVVGAYGHPAATVGNNWLGLTQGDTKYQREGDSIYSKYVDYSIYLQAYADRVNQKCRIIIVKGTGSNANNYSSTSISDWFITDGTSSGSGYLMSQPVDQTKFQVLKDIVVDVATYPGIGTTQTTVKPSYPVVRGRIKTGYKVQYEAGSAFPQDSKHRIQIAIIPYAADSVTTDNVLQAVVEVVHHFCDF